VNDTSESFVQRRRVMVRNDIGRIAIDLFAERGFDAVTVDDIALAAGISPRTFFRYFGSKDEVILDYDRRLQHRIVTAFDEQPSSLGAVAALRLAYLSTAHIEPEDRPHVVRLGQILDRAPALQARVQGVLIDETLLKHVAARLRVSADDPLARTIVAGMGAVVNAEFRAWVQRGGDGDPSGPIADALDLLVRGLASADSQSRSRRGTDV
jgi:AcrR family transcriptional regulator